MSADHNLPVILVSAVDTAAALAIIKEVISDDPEPPQSNGVSSHAGAPDSDEDEGGAGVVWRLHNKYYTARVRMLPCPDRARRLPAGDVQAHLIYLTQDECSDSSALSRRAAAAASRVARGGVRLAAARGGAGAAGVLQAAADAARYELVPLDEPAAPPAPPAPPARGEPFPELRGAARLREALHAHPWPGLQRRGAARPPLHFAEEDSSAESSGDESWGSWRRASSEGEGEGEGEAGAVERAEQFAAALALLPAAAEAVGRGEGDGEGDAERRLRAEQLVTAFCRALGHDLAGDADGGPQ